jgi:hypothetical protein
MIRRASWLAAALVFATSFGLQAQSLQGLQLRVDRSTNAADPDDVPDVKLAMVGPGLEVTTGPAAVLWNPANTVTGNYTLKARFSLLAPSDHINFYGLVFGGSNLDQSSQNYLYFLVAQNGHFIIKHRANDQTTHDVVASTRHIAVAEMDTRGQSANDLEVRVTTDRIDYVVNGTVVHTTPRQGMTARTDGIWGFRINHRLPGIRIENVELIRTE